MLCGTSCCKPLLWIQIMRDHFRINYAFPQMDQGLTFSASCLTANTETVHVVINWDPTCGSTKGCFPTPEQCSINCNYLVKWQPFVDTDEVEFTLQRKATGDKWIAIGFSDNRAMLQTSLQDSGLLKRKKRTSPDEEAKYYCTKSVMDKDGFKLQFISDYKGFGVFSEKHLNAGDVLLQYCGERISAEEGRRRLSKIGTENKCFFYEFRGEKLWSSDGSFLREILKEERVAMVTNGGTEDRALDLVLGDDIDNDLMVYKNLVGSPHSSISNDDMASDPGDPIHSESILNELFYKQLASPDELSDLSCDETTTEKHNNLDDPTNLRPPSRTSSLSSLNLAFPEPEKKKQKPVRTPKRKSRLKLRRKGSKKRRGSKSRSRASASDASDSEALSTASTPRSESSRVSFDMVPSDIDEPPDHSASRKVAPDGLSVERLTLLGRVHVARVTIENLQLIGQDMDTSTSKLKKSKYGMKPPKPSPKIKKPCTYFIEYQFPVVATSRDKYSPNAMATEVMRVVSRTVKNNDAEESDRLCQMVNDAPNEDVNTVMKLKVFSDKEYLCLFAVKNIEPDSDDSDPFGLDADSYVPNSDENDLDPDSECDEVAMIHMSDEDSRFSAVSNISKQTILEFINKNSLESIGKLTVKEQYWKIRTKLFNERKTMREKRRSKLTEITVTK